MPGEIHWALFQSIPEIEDLSPGEQSVGQRGVKTTCNASLEKPSFATLQET